METRKEQIEKLALALDEKGYDRTVRIRGISWMPVRDALKIYYEQHDHKEIAGPAPPVRIYIPFPRVWDGPFNSITIEVKDDPIKGLNPTAYTIRKCTSLLGQLLIDKTIKVNGLKEVPSKRELEEGALKEVIEKKELKREVKKPPSKKKKR